MPKLSAETLKQIQKPGLSVSLVSTDNSRSTQQLEPPGAKEMKAKQITTEVNKNQSRISQVNCTHDSKHPTSAGRNNPLTFEGKFPSISNTIEKIVISSQNPQRSDNSKSMMQKPQGLGNPSTKVSGMQRIQPVNMCGKLVPSEKGGDVKLPTQLLMSQIVKGTPAERMRQPQVVPVDRQPPVVPLDRQSPTSTNAGMPTSFRGVLKPNERASAVQEDKTVKVNRMVANNSYTKSQSTVQMKKFQSTSMQVESKAISQVVKMNSRPSDSALRMQVSFDNLASSDVNMPSTRTTPTKRIQATRSTTITPNAKRKCVKKALNVEELDCDKNSLSPRTKQIEMQKRGVTITPVTTTTSATSKRVVTESTPITNNIPIECPHCREDSHNYNNCDHCNKPLPTAHMKVVNPGKEPAKAIYVTQTTTRVERIICHLPADMNKNPGYYQGMDTRGGRGTAKSRRRKVEPVCYTLSSDDEEPVPVIYEQMEATAMQNCQIYPIESEGSKSDHSSISETMPDDNPEFDDSEYPGVVDINPNLHEEDPHPEMDYDRGEDEEDEEESEMDESREDDSDESMRIPEGKPTDYPLRTRSVRIGSYKIHPHVTSSFVPVIFSPDSLSFQAAVLPSKKRTIHITIKREDIKKVFAHFGKCLPILFIYTTEAFGETIRNALQMEKGSNEYFDPGANDDKTEKLTFLIDAITDLQKHFIRQVFPGEKKVFEIDQKTANEILVKSTPQATNMVVKLNIPESPHTPSTSEARIPHVSSQISVTRVTIPEQTKPLPKQPVFKLITYPAPPMAGGIDITNEDLNCLNEGEFLNDVIIDFYLKYLFYEKLSPVIREKTHIFSSFFFHRLTLKPERPRSGDDYKSMQERRHNQVKTWTRHVDIFSKDYIIIPINQNVHWYLAIICFPHKVPEAADDPEPKRNENVTSSDEQEHMPSNVTIREISSNGEDDSPNPDDNSLNNSSANSPYEVEEPPDSDGSCAETPDSSTHPDNSKRSEAPCICIFDSLSGPPRQRVVNILREYLEIEWLSKKGTKKLFNKNTIQGTVMKCPQQNNFSDCGTFVLQYAESFFEQPSMLNSPILSLENMFSESKISRKRQQLKNLILQLQERQKPRQVNPAALKPINSDNR